MKSLIYRIYKIIIAEFDSQNFKSFESLSVSIVDELFEEMKTSGEFDLLDKKIESFFKLDSK